MHRILLVEDDKSVSRLYQLELEDDGYEVKTADNSAEATRLVDTWKPECTIIDIKLGDENGLDLLRVVLEHAPNMHTILVSAYPGYREDFNSWLADAFVTKQSDTSNLRHTLGEVLDLHSVH